MVAVNTGAGFQYPPENVWNSSWCANHQRCPMRDINGDGLDDLVAFTPDFGLVWTSLGWGGGFGGNAVWQDFFCIRGEVCAPGDIDGDGLDDAIAFKPLAPGVEMGNVLWARSTGSGFSAPSYALGFFCIDNEQCLIGDGRDDGVLVKGWGSAAVPTLEVLVSLSNGQAFINAEPFMWGNPAFLDPSGQSYGIFDLADVASDRRDDLVQWGAVFEPTAGGSARSKGFRVQVSAITNAPVSPSPTPGEGQLFSGASGYGNVVAYNCQTEQARLCFWTVDQASDATTEPGLTDAMFDEWGTCPDPTDAPESFAASDSGLFTVVAANPDAIGGEGRNGPSIVA